MKPSLAKLAQLNEFDEIIDARSPAEFAADHIPGARNCPALDDAERARIGTLYVQVSAFAARRAGAALVARHIAAYLEACFAERPRDWRPLIYCWRGGKRSGAFVTVFREIGWDAAQLDGGYKTFRRHVIERLEALPATLRFQVVCGPTGCGKTRLLQALAARGAQVLDLETLASHKGSVLGGLPDASQPGQRHFETKLLTALEKFDPERNVFVEAESRRIGALALPTTLIDAMRNSPCLEVDASVEARVAFLLRDYAHLLSEPGRLSAALTRLRLVQGGERTARWQQLADERSWDPLVRELLEHHYDPQYRRSQLRHYRQPAARYIRAKSLASEELDALAGEILAVPALHTAHGGR